MMVFEEKEMDLFNVPEHYALAQCISADLAMGKGIAVEFNKHYNIKHILTTKYEGLIRASWNTCQESRKIRILQEGNIFNLVTKCNYYEKPTYRDLSIALRYLKTGLIEQGIHYIAMPRIGCGLDGLSWNKVSSIIKHIFEDTNIHILICYI